VEANLAIGVPPVANRVTGKLAGIVTGANLDVPQIGSEVIQPVRHRHACCQGGPIMVKYLHCFLGVQFPLSIERTNQFFFWVSILTTGLPAA